MTHFISPTFEKALKKSEQLALKDLYNRYCVVLKYGIYGVFTVDFARDHDYPVVSETIY